MFDRTYPFLVFVLLFDQDTIKLFSHDGINDIHFGLVYYPQLITRLVDYRLERRGGGVREGETADPTATPFELGCSGVIGAKSYCCRRCCCCCIQRNSLRLPKTYYTGQVTQFYLSV